MNVNMNFLNLNENYLFSTISKKVDDFLKSNPGKEVIRLGIGDVTLPICNEVIKGLHAAVEDMSTAKTFHGYGPEQGYDFLRTKIKEHYQSNGASVEMEEIFVSDGAKSDAGNILDLFDQDNTVLIPDPVYPVYVDTNVMDSRKILFLDANESNGFLPLPEDDKDVDIIYICSPNNPTGAVYSKEQLKLWVDYANKKNAVILFDAAYEAFIDDASFPHSIFEIDGSKTCAIEFCSLSKTAGFTGLRCGYTVVPKDLKRCGVSLNKLWLRRQTTKFNGVSYITQKGAEAVFSPKGQMQIKDMVQHYKENAKIIASCIDELGIWFTGGKSSPYIWMKCPNRMSSWEFFDFLLKEANVVGTPGSGFGKNGEGFFRLTAFGDKNKTIKAMSRIKKVIR